MSEISTKGLVAVLRTSDSPVPLVLRIGLGIVILPHGLQKAFGWFDGFGFEGTMAYFTETMGFPWILGLAAVLAETVGALLLLAGAGTRLAATAIGVTMAVALLTVHAPYGFFMNWSGAQGGEGIEYFLLAIALAAALVLAGGGAISVDRAVASRTSSTRAAA